MQIGIDPPRGVLLYGPPGTGKTMLAKAVAHHTTAAFIRVVGSEFVQKYLGEGPRMVRDVFRLAKENAPAIIFIDEVDAIATARFDAQTGADREVQRILMELLNQMDGAIYRPQVFNAPRATGLQKLFITGYLNHYVASFPERNLRFIAFESVLY